MIRVLHLPNWKPAADAGKTWVLCIGRTASRFFATQEAAEHAAHKLADITGSTLNPTR